MKRKRVNGIELPNRNDKALMRVRLMEDRTLSPSAKLVGHQLVDHFNIKTGRCDPGTARLIQKTGYSKRRIYEARKELVDAGYVVILRHGGGSQTNAYAINWSLVDRNAVSRIWTDAESLTTTSAKKGRATGAEIRSQTFEGTLEKKPLADGRRRNASTTSVPGPLGPSWALNDWKGSNRLRSSTVMYKKAQERLEKDLQKHFGDHYASALQVISEAILENATLAEIKSRGGGLAVVLMAMGKRRE